MSVLCIWINILCILFFNPLFFCSGKDPDPTLIYFIYLYIYVQHFYIFYILLYFMPTYKHIFFSFRIKVGSGYFFFSSAGYGCEGKLSGSPTLVFVPKESTIATARGKQSCRLIKPPFSHIVFSLQRTEEKKKLTSSNERILRGKNFCSRVEDFAFAVWIFVCGEL